MLRLIILAPILAGACSAMAAQEPQIPVHGETPGHVCRSEGLDGYVGRSRSAELEAELKRRSGAAIVRWVAHGSMITMEFRSDRLTVWLDAGGRIDRLSCS